MLYINVNVRIQYARRLVLYEHLLARKRASPTKLFWLALLLAEVSISEDERRCLRHVLATAPRYGASRDLRPNCRRLCFTVVSTIGNPGKLT